jgi:hypothetical protein
LITARRTTRWVLALTLLLALSVLAMGKLASADEVGPPSEEQNITPILVPDNPTCKTQGFDYELKVEGAAPNGTYFDDKKHADELIATGPLSVTISNSDGLLFDWASNIGVDQVIVKASDNADAFVYDPGKGEVQSDTRLHGPVKDDGTYRDISHVSFCYDVENNLVPLEVEKTANGSYDRKFSWELEKSVAPTTHSGLAGDSFNSTWTVTATKKVEDSNYKVTGDIVITNPNAQAVNFSVSDELSDNTSAAVTCPALTVPANDSVTCPYTASPADNLATSNTATVTSNTQSVDGNSDTADITWTAKETGDKEVTLADPRFPNNVDLNKTINNSTTVEQPETFKCPTDKAAYITNPLVTKYKNTATLKGTYTDLSRYAEVNVTCKYPWVDETATGKGPVYKGATGTQNWFMYTPYPTEKVDLMAGKFYDAGDIYFTRNVTTTITITLADMPVKFRWAKVVENMKVEAFKTAPTKFVQPGTFKYKKTCNQALSTCTITGLPNVDFYGIHADVERYAP